MIGKIVTRSLEMEINLKYDFNIFFIKNNEESKRENAMNESVHVTLYELSRRKQQGTSFLVETQLQQWKNKRERKIDFPLLSFLFELLEFLNSKGRMRLFVRLGDDDEEVFDEVRWREFMSVLIFLMKCFERH